MSKLRSLSTAFWSDPFIEDLTPEEKLLFVYLVTNDKTNMLGIYESSIRKISFETGLSKESINSALDRFEAADKVKYSENYVILKNYMKHQNFNTNMKKSAIDTYNNLPNHLKIKGLIVDKANPSEGFERLSKAFGMVSKIEYELEYEYEEEKEPLIETSEEIKQLDVDYVQLFLKDWNEQRTEILKKPSYLNRLSFDLKELLKEIWLSYTRDQIITALKGLFRQKVLPHNNTSMLSSPKHFLNNFERYLTAGIDMNPQLYGTHD